LIAANTFTSNGEVRQRFDNGNRNSSKTLAPKPVVGQRQFLLELKRYLGGFEQVDIANLKSLLSGT